MEDYLDEDPVITNQKYAVLSYALPLKEGDNPMVKIRGSFSTVEECERRIKKLQTVDKYFHMFAVEVGKWGSLLTEEQLKSDDSLNVVYQNEIMNNMMKEYKGQKDKADEEFEKRKEEMKKKAIEDGTPEGQKRLAEEKENVLSVKKRLSDSQEVINKLEKDLQEYKEIFNNASAKLSEYTEEEVHQAEKKLGKLTV